MENNFKTSKFFIECIENYTDDRIAKLFIDITKTKIICINDESFIFYKFDNQLCIYECIQLNEFTKIVKNELDNYIQEIKKNNTDKRISNLEKKILDYSSSLKIAKSCAQYLYDKTFLSKLDTNTDEFHFKNGYINLRDGKFHKRNSSHLISKCNNYDYINKSNKEVDEAMIFLIEKMKNICNDDNDILEFSNAFFGYCLTGEIKEQLCLFSIGLHASNGKSTLSEMFSKSFSNYCYKMDRSAIESDGKNIHKSIAECKGMRYVYVEEFEKRINTSLFKDLIGSKSISNQVLYGTTELIQITFKLNIISNYLFDVHSDKGVERRGRMIEFKNRFLDEYDNEYKPNTKGIYKKDKFFLDKFDNDVYKNALFKILLPYAIKFYKDGCIKCNYMNTSYNNFKQICNENDKMKPFIESCFIITNNDEDRIHKDHFINLYNTETKYNNKWIKILSDAKRCNLNYNCDKRTVYNGKSEKGCFIGLKLRECDADEENEDEIKINPIDDEVKIVKENINYKELFEKTQSQNELLLEKIKELEKQIKKQKNEPEKFIDKKINKSVKQNELKQVEEKIYNDADLDDLVNLLK